MNILCSLGIHKWVLSSKEVKIEEGIKTKILHKQCRKCQKMKRGQRRFNGEGMGYIKWKSL